MLATYIYIYIYIYNNHVGKTIINHPPNHHFYRCYKAFPNDGCLLLFALSQWRLSAGFPRSMMQGMLLFTSSICILEARPCHGHVPAMSRPLFPQENIWKLHGFLSHRNISALYHHFWDFPLCKPPRATPFAMETPKWPMTISSLLRS